MLGKVTFQAGDGKTYNTVLDDDGEWSCDFMSPEYARGLNATSCIDSYSPADGQYGGREIMRVAELLEGTPFVDQIADEPELDADDKPAEVVY